MAYGELERGTNGRKVKLILRFLLRFSKKVEKKTKKTFILLFKIGKDPFILCINQVNNSHLNVSHENVKNSKISIFK